MTRHPRSLVSTEAEHVTSCTSRVPPATGIPLPLCSWFHRKREENKTGKRVLGNQVPSSAIIKLSLKTRPSYYVHGSHGCAGTLPLRLPEENPNTQKTNPPIKDGHGQAPDMQRACTNSAETEVITRIRQFCKQTLQSGKTRAMPDTIPTLRQRESLQFHFFARRTKENCSATRAHVHVLTASAYTSPHVCKEYVFLRPQNSTQSGRVPANHISPVCPGDNARPSTADTSR